MTARTVVFTDLDGSLLDHDSYSFSAAAPALTELRRLGIPWVLNTSKTAAELAELRQRLNNPYPYIVENGAAVVFPAGSDGAVAGSTWSLAPTRREVLSALHGWRETHGVCFRGFADMSAPEVCALTGLPRHEAILARRREYSEPIVWWGGTEQWQDFVAMLAARGLRAQRGGRFIHIAGDCDKGRAMQWLAPRLIPGCSAPRCIALGDGDNDVAMLALADEAVIIRSAHHAPPAVPSPQGRVQLSAACGPAGWNASLLSLLALEQ